MGQIDPKRRFDLLDVQGQVSELTRRSGRTHTARASA